ncbi:MAG: hypothetical protein AUJ97_05835 [Bacteroidetes bacterium CG2_30_32_10]|nr:MAG: hypothetical protein AUJ97_05835 [Bacteroidetes bacterium CG2_30_32_10]
MATIEITMPRLGESIIEATITKWLKNEGDMITEDESVVEIATDKVDSEVPSPVSGTIAKLLFKVGDVVSVGAAIAIVNIAGESTIDIPKPIQSDVKKNEIDKIILIKENSLKLNEIKSVKSVLTNSDKFYSPLVKSIAKEEGISFEEIELIVGTGKGGRVTKQDIIEFIKTKKIDTPKLAANISTENHIIVNSSPNDEIIEMDRMRKLIADHMILSKHTAAHVTSFIEIDVTKIVQWRMSMKEAFEKQEKEKLTYTPIFVEATAKVIKEYPLINTSLDGNKIILRKSINIGMATALPSGNLIVPVIKNADRKSLIGLVKDVNDLANRARLNKLIPDEIQGGTFTITNLGSFDTLMGTPIINLPQVAILAVGAIQKKPVVIETPTGDTIGIRNMMYASLSYDHRVVDGALGGIFLKRFKYYLENFDINHVF